ncbi:MAG: hypothetical protein ACKOZV_01710 [Bacteroidota bacterium]
MPDRAKKTEGGGPPALSKEKERRAVFLWPFQPMFYYLKDISPGSVHQHPAFFIKNTRFSWFLAEIVLHLRPIFQKVHFFNVTD